MISGLIVTTCDTESVFISSTAFLTASSKLKVSIFKPNNSALILLLYLKNENLWNRIFMVKKGVFGMKKILTVLALIAFTSTAFAATSVTTRLNNGLNAINKKEQALNKKIDNAQAKRAASKAQAEKNRAAAQARVDAKKAEVAKKQAEQKAAIEKSKADAKARVEAQKKAVNDTKANAKNTAKNTKKAAKNEANFWKSLFSNK